MLRVTGIVIFALLVGVSANSLYDMHESGQLLEKYNSSRKSNITLLGVSILALGVLGFFELTRVRRTEARRGYGGSAYDSDPEDAVDGLDTTSIYAAPKTMDAWQGRRTHASKSRSRKQQFEMTDVWMGLLRICCIVLPLLYLGLLVINLIRMNAAEGVVWLLPTVFSALIFLSLVTAFGVFRKKGWGMSLGYVLAICNLLVFPFGTAIGLFLLMGLVGSTPLFAVPASERRRNARRKAAKKVQAAAI